MTSHNRNDEEYKLNIATTVHLEESEKIRNSGVDIVGNEIDLSLSPSADMETMTSPDEDDLEEMTFDLAMTNSNAMVYSNSFTESTIKDHERQMQMNHLKSKAHADGIDIDLGQKLMSKFNVDGFDVKGTGNETHFVDTANTLLTQLAIASALEEKLFYISPLPLEMAAIDLARAQPYNPNLDFDNDIPQKTKSFWHRFIHGFHRRISFLLPTPLKKQKILKVDLTPTVNEEERVEEALNDTDTVFEEIDLN